MMSHYYNYMPCDKGNWSSVHWKDTYSVEWARGAAKDSGPQEVISYWDPDLHQPDNVF